MPKKNYMDTKATAIYLMTTREALYAMIQRGQVPYIRVGKRKILFCEEDLITFLEAHAVTPNVNGRRKR
jgi:excisionase family DNA binding protein